jgi:hypothetical protein
MEGAKDFNNTNQMNNTMSIEEFCGLHDACADGRKWALANCVSMEDAWAKLKHEWLLWVATRPGVLTQRELRKFAVWCARQVQHLMTDPRSVAALDVAERHAEGLATDEELAAARAAGVAAWAAARAAGDATGAAGVAAWAAGDATGAAGVAAWAAGVAAWAAAWAAAGAVRVAARAAANAAEDAQAAWLRENTKPNFGKTK